MLIINLTESNITTHQAMQIVFKRQIHEMSIMQLTFTTNLLRHILRDHPQMAAVIATN